MKTISPEDLDKSLKSDSPQQILDVLTEESYRYEHTPNSRNACVY